jgi:hypothetical protein
MKTRAAVSITALAAMSLTQPARAQRSPIEVVVQEADAVIVGSFTGVVRSGNGSSVNVHIERVLKNGLTAEATLTAGDLLKVQGPAVSESSAPGVNPCAIWFLKRENGTWSAVPVQPGGSLRSMRTPLASCSAPQNFVYDSNTNVVDRVLSEVAESGETLKGKGQAARLYSYLKGSRSSVAIRTVQRFEASQFSELRAVALGLKMFGGDVCVANS